MLSMLLLPMSRIYFASSITFWYLDLGFCRCHTNCYKQSISSPPSSTSDQVILASLFSKNTKYSLTRWKNIPQKKKFVASEGFEPPFPTQHERQTRQESKANAAKQNAEQTRQEPFNDTTLWAIRGWCSIQLNYKACLSYRINWIPR
jgi:hypothetical protein